MFTLLRLELEKLFRAKSFYLSFTVLIGFVALMLWGFYTYAARKTGGQAVEQFKYTYESKEYFNGLTFALYSVLFSFTLLLPIFVSMSAGSQIAGEARAGTLRMICTRPISRASLVLTKFFVTALHAGLLLSFFIGLNLVVGLIFVGWGNLELYPGPLNLVDAPGKIMRDEALLRFAYAALSGTWALLVVAALALVCSVVSDSPVQATVMTIAAYLTLYIVGRVEFFEHLRPYFFTTDMDFWRDVFKPDIPWDSLWHNAFICGAYTTGLLLLAVVIFERKDIVT
ncbi:MAG TPA: ABC transporter permease [Pyrinomonadaceae bacterium]|jgi:ABC-2 type transport system permease protein|nr:ABC transporter permease [Pyrinomonadaceae bacterium]